MMRLAQGRRAERKGIVLELKIQPLPGDTAIEKKDLCALFANLLDNAVEAARGRIMLSVRKVHGMLVIVAENDYTGEPVMEENRFVTSKEDRERHGWGTRIVEEIVKKYDGSIGYEVGELFRVELMLNG